jgi:hypothetical protein
VTSTRLLRPHLERNRQATASDGPITEPLEELAKSACEAKDAEDKRRHLLQAGWQLRQRLSGVWVPWGGTGSMSETSGGAGWWQASDGRWYPPETRPTLPPPPSPPPEQQYGAPVGGYAPPPPQIYRRPSRRWPWVVGIAAVLLIGGVVAVVLLTTQKNDATTAGSNLPSGTSLSSFQSSVQSQLSGSTTTGGFAISGIATVTCNMTSAWQVGNHFKCFAYNSNNSEVGEADGIVQPSTSSGWSANLHWLPNPTYSGGTGNSGNSGTVGNSGNSGNTGNS